MCLTSIAQMIFGGLWITMHLDICAFQFYSVVSSLCLRLLPRWSVPSPLPSIRLSAPLRWRPSLCSQSVSLTALHCSKSWWTGTLSQGWGIGKKYLLHLHMYRIHMELAGLGENWLSRWMERDLLGIFFHSPAPLTLIPLLSVVN